MTHEEIMNMSEGKEIDDLVAEKVMGWHAIEERGFNHWVDADGRFQCGVAPYDGYEDAEDFHTLKWHPSESILWAWEVMEIIKQKYNFSILMHSYDTKWEMAIYVDEKTDEYGRLFATADTAPLAICRVALLTLIRDEQ